MKMKNLRVMSYGRKLLFGNLMDQKFREHNFIVFDLIMKIVALLQNC